MIEGKKSEAYHNSRRKIFDEDESEKDEEFEERESDIQLKPIIQWWTIVEMTIITIALLGR